MKLISIFLLVGVLFPGGSQACHWTHIEIRNGTDCCKVPEVVRTVKEDMPNFQSGRKTTSTDDPTTATGDIKTTTTPSPNPDPGPVGDCPCGATGMKEELEMGILAQDTAGVTRPWLAHIKIQKDSGEPVECTGSLLNMRWLISAAHCLCGTVVRCNENYSAYTKVFTGEQFDSSKIKVSMQGAPDTESAKVMKLVIHPNYFSYTGNTVVGNTDLALLRLDRDMFQLEDGKIVGNVAPICLPAKLGFRVNENRTEDGIHQPFEDLDCFLIEPDTAVPYPYHKKRSRLGWLACHPGAMAAAEHTDIAGRSSRITAFGQVARQDFNQKVRGRCLTNSYGPSDSILERCTGECHIGTSEAGLDNPSQANQICADFMKTKLKEALEIHNRRMGSEEEKRLNFLGWIKIKAEGEEDLTCYPHKSEVLETAQNMWDFPYRHGWCTVCASGDRVNCEARPGAGWGWCLPQCDQNTTSSLPLDKTNIAREAHVESFVYENCSSNVNVMTEFCTGAPLVSGYGQVWTFQGGQFVLVGHEVRKYHEQLDSRTVVQHHDALGAACYGDAGGSVWKLWKFFAADGSGRLEERAVLTGVLSRFEEQCGVQWAGLRDRNKTIQHHMVHTRVTAVLDWINMWIADGKCSGPAP